MSFIFLELCVIVQKLTVWLVKNDGFSDSIFREMSNKKKIMLNNNNCSDIFLIEQETLSQKLPCPRFPNFISNKKAQYGPNHFNLTAGCGPK